MKTNKLFMQKRYKYRINLGLFSVLILSIVSCTSSDNNKIHSDANENSIDFQTDLRTYKVKLQHARCFAIDYHENYKQISLLNILNPSDTLQKYILCTDTSAYTLPLNNAVKIQIPLKSAACLSSLYAAYMEKLNLLDKLNGIDNHLYIHSEKIRTRIKQSANMDLGDISKLNIEKTVSLRPDVLFTFMPANASSSQHALLSKNNIKFAYMLDQEEPTPLARAEWLVFLAAFFNKETEASGFITELTQRYDSLKSLVSSGNAVLPEVLTGIKYGDIWYMPGGKSYLSQLIRDAGAMYVLENDTSHGVLHLSFEEVYQKAAKADYWINISSFKNLNEVHANDSRYTWFKAFKMKNIFNTIARVNSNGGNDYWESGMLNPDLILKDLIHIFHPGKLKNHSFMYYQKLE